MTRVVEVIDWPQFTGGAAFAGFGGLLADIFASAPFAGIAAVMFVALAVGKITEWRESSSTAETDGGCNE